MKYLTFLLTFCCAFMQISGQEMKAIQQLSKEELLGIAAYKVFQTNKFLDFRNKITLREYIGGKLCKTSDLKKAYGSLDWEAIEKEDTAAYRTMRRSDGSGKFTYEYTDSTMTEVYSYEGDKVKTEIETVYNTGGFVLLHLERKEYTLGPGSHPSVEAKTTINVFDDRNRVIKITDRTEGISNRDEVILVTYGENEVLVTSNIGEIRCELVPGKDEDPFYSSLNPRETASDFMYLLMHKRFNLARKYCMDKALGTLMSLSSGTPVESVRFISGSGSLRGEKRTEIKDRWGIQYGSTPEEEYQVDFTLIESEHGWKISELVIKK